jgi:phosphonate transport system substrate-binding protein
MLSPARGALADRTVSLGLNPVFLDSDIELLAKLKRYLTERLGRPVELVKRRTYQEIDALLLSAQIDAAWICDFPYVQFEDKLALIAVPLYQGKPRYQTYIIVNEASTAQAFDDLKGTTHAFSDPDSTSGYLVTRYLLAVRHTNPAQFFRDSFFTYGHRNVVRAVAMGLAESGSMDGYVWDVMRQREPELINKTRVVYRTDELGFPPVAGLTSMRESAIANGFASALLTMADDPLGRQILSILGLDGFTPGSPDLYGETRMMWHFVQGQA